MFQRGIAPVNALDEKSKITDPSGTLAGTFPVSKLSDKSTTCKLTESFKKSTERADIATNIKLPGKERTVHETRNVTGQKIGTKIQL